MLLWPSAKVMSRPFFENPIVTTLKPELVSKALEKVGNPNVLVNIVSRRVRQLNAGGGPGSRPLIVDTAGLGLADVALTEVIEDKMDWELTMAEEYAPPDGA